MIHNFKSKMFNIVENYPNAGRLLKEILNTGETLLLGGALREFKDNGLIKMPRDFDIVVDVGDNDSLLDSILLPYNPQKNRFGGYKINYGDLVIDIWSLYNTWAFKEKKIICNPNEYSLRLQDTVFLNMDALVYNFTRDIWYESKYKEAMKSKILDVVLEENPQLPLNIIRAIILKRKYSMKFSTNLKLIFYNYMLSCHNYLEDLIEIQISHYNHVEIEKEEIEKELKNILY